MMVCSDAVVAIGLLTWLVFETVTYKLLFKRGKLGLVLLWILTLGPVPVGR
jgi:hypothetical protein